MMIFRLLLAILAPWLIAFSVVSAVWPGARPLRSDLLLKSCLAVGVSFGILSCAFFVQLSLFGASQNMFLSSQIALLILALAALFYRVKSQRNTMAGGPAGERPPRSKLGLSLTALFFVALTSAIIAFLFISLKQPHGEWDAWAVYNMKARFLFKAGDYWRDLFSEPMIWSGPDYPLMLPAAISATWTLIGRETVVVPPLVALLFALATIGTVTLTVSMCRGKSQGFLAGLVLTCTPFLITHAANQYSDIPIGFFFSATIVLLTLSDKFGNGSNRFLSLAGLTAGLSPWTKNEGLLFIVAILISRFIVMGRSIGLKNYLRQMWFFGVGLAPALSVVLLFKATVAARNGLLFPNEGPSLAHKLFDISRYMTIADGFVRQALTFGDWSVSIIPVLILYLLLAGTKVDDKEKTSVVASLMILGIMLSGYAMVYLLTPRDVYWHVVNSINRLFTQLWPSFVFIFFLIVRTPEEALARRNVISAPS